jgi:PAS domain S-box-containing protein
VYLLHPTQFPGSITEIDITKIFKGAAPDPFRIIGCYVTIRGVRGSVRVSSGILDFLKKRPFSQYLLLVVIVLIISVVAGITAIDFINEQATFERNSGLLQVQTEENLVEALQLVDEGFKLYDNTLNRQMKENFNVFLEEYNRSGMDPEKMDLTGIQQVMGNNIDLYIINESGVIQFSTYKPEIGLDFRTLPYFFDYLNRVRLSEGFFPDRVVRETATGKLRKFAYMPTPDHRYILELGLTGEELTKERGSLQYKDIINRIASHNPYLQNVRIFNTKGNFIGNTENFPDPERDKIISKVTREKTNLEIVNSTTGITIKYLFINLKDPDYGSDTSLIVELTYDSQLVRDALNDLLLMRLLIALIALMVGLGAALMVSEYLTRPIRGMVEDVDQIAQGDLDHTIRKSTGMEFQKLEKSINSMVSTLEKTIRRQKEVESELRVSEERYRMISDLISDYAYAMRVEPTGTITLEWATGAFRSIFGTTIEEVQNEGGWSLFIHPEDTEILDEHRRKLFENKSHVSEFRVISKNGEVHWINHRTQPEWDEKEGRFLRFYAAGQDITGRKHTEDELFRILKAVESASDAIGISDPDGIHIYQNHAFSSLFGYDVEELHSPWGPVILYGDRDTGHEVFETIIGGNSWNGEIIMVAKNGRRFPVALRADAITDDKGNIIGLIGIHTDITARKQVEEELRRLNEGLEARVSSRTAQLEMINKELESFSYMVSHDLRAPLRAIDGFSRIVLDDYTGDLPDEGKRYLSLVRENVSQMRALIDNLINFSHMSRKSLNIGTCHPADIVRGAVDDLRNEQVGRAVKIVIDDLPSCRADPDMLKLVFINLISNALKFTRICPETRIEIGSIRKEGHNVYFIRDNGIGFDMRYSPMLFVVFQRLHPIKEYEGTGLGLAIVQRIIHRHGGDVWAEAEIDRGATFFFTIDGGTGDKQ